METLNHSTVGDRRNMGATVAKHVGEQGKSTAESKSPFTKKESNGIKASSSAVECTVPALREENMSSEDLSTSCFKEEDLICPNNSHKRSSVSSSEKKCSKEYDAHYSHMKHGHRKTCMTQTKWQLHKEQLLKQEEARDGRDIQRYETYLQTGERIRLNAGCVPIMKDGKILLLSSRKKPEWILPKGGWELDESVEECAMRESYEEAGILGTLGLPLKDTIFEARKAKLKRLESERMNNELNQMLLMKQNQKQSSRDSSTTRTDSTTASSPTNLNDSGEEDALNLAQKTRCLSIVHPIKKIMCFFSMLKKIATEKQRHKEKKVLDTSSLPCTHVRLSMFPMYVLEVKEDWPERGRARKIVDIDTAIEIMSSRPEFQTMLLEVKEKGYHLNIPNQPR